MARKCLFFVQWEVSRFTDVIGAVLYRQIVPKSSKWKGILLLYHALKIKPGKLLDGESQGGDRHCDASRVPHAACPRDATLAASKLG